MENQLLDLGKLSQYRIQKVNILIADTSPAGFYQSTIQLDRQFNLILGVGFVEKDDGGIPLLYDVGGKTDRQTWLDPINVGFWTANGNVGPMQKYYSVNIGYASGDTWFAMINTEAAIAGSDFKAQMVLFLSKSLNQVPR